jgi:signal transduction histidine kinase
MLRLDLEKASRPEAGAAERIGRKLTTAIKMTRDLAHGLRPVNFENEDLALALHQLARNTCEDFDVCCSAECVAGKLITDPNVAMHAFRIAREAVHNAVKHGQPKQIVIRLNAETGRLQLTVTDDGRGISADPKPGPGMGLEIMKYRASMICGTLEIRPRLPAEGSGTILSCSFPQAAPA